MGKRNAESIRFFRPSDMEYVQVVCGMNVTNEFPRHVHDTFCMGTVQQGERVISQKGMSTVIPQDGLFIINPDTSHSCKSRHKEGHSYRIICIKARTMQNIASQISEKSSGVPYFSSVLLDDHDLTRWIREFFSLVEQRSSVLQRESLLISTLSQLVLRHGHSPPTPCEVGSQHGAIKRVRQFIEMHYAENPSLQQLSRVACLSPFHFQRVFLMNTGVSPHDYLVQFRIRKAQELLLNGRSIADVALDTGFADQSHFTRSFKRVVGIAPGGYVRLYET